MMSYNIKRSDTIMFNKTYGEELHDGEWWDKLEINQRGSNTHLNMSTNLEEFITTESWDVDFKNSSRFWVQFVIIPIVVLVGMIGNVVTACILTRKEMQTPSTMYLTSLAFTDFLFLAFSLSMSMKHYDCMKDVWLYWQYVPFGLWITAALNSTSIWLTVSFTIERYVAVCHPLTGRVNCIRKRAKYVSFAVWIISFLLTSYIPSAWKVVTKEIPNDEEDSFGTYRLNKMVYSVQKTDHGKHSRYGLFFHWLIFTVCIVIPFFVLALLNGLLIQAVQESRRNRENLTNSQLKNRQEARIKITLVFAVIVFLICQLPMAVLRMYTSWNRLVKPGAVEENILIGIENICELLMCINAACNFLLYTALSDRFKRAFATVILSTRSSRDIPMNVI